MFIFKIAKAVVKFFLGLALGIFLVYFIVAGTYHAVRTPDPVYKDMTDCIRVYNVNREQVQNGEYTYCPVCRKNFQKRNNFNFCSKVCSDEYYVLKTAWDNGDRWTVEAHGKKFR